MATVAAPGRPSAGHAWWLAIRPKTLAVAMGPVAVGTATAASEGTARGGPALAALAGALLLQIGSNLANDVYDAEKGADGDDRLGPPRAVQQGWLTAPEVRRGMMAAFAAAAVVGLYLTSVAGWPVIAIGLLSVATAIAYTGGPWPLGYHGLGDLAVFVFFGIVAVCGTHYVQALSISATPLLAALPVGALATAVLVVNNLRDVDSDGLAGKRTLAVRLGPEGARREFVLLVCSAYLVVIATWATGRHSAWVLLPLTSAPLAAPLVLRVVAGARGIELNDTLAQTARLGLVFSLLFAAGWAL
jgi:1,4-dihydroxy-2-naphthoate octaprenyltransferase